MRRTMKLESDLFIFEKSSVGSTVSVFNIEGIEIDAFTIGVERNIYSWEDFEKVCIKYKKNNGGG